MARMVSWPAGIGWTSREPLSGPRAVGASSSESLEGYVQSTASVYGLWRWQWSLPPLRGERSRRWRGFVSALHGGANAARVRFTDPDGLGWGDCGVTTPTATLAAGLTWSHGLPWSNGAAWRPSRPWVAVAEAAPLGAVEIRLAATDWGARLGVGDLLGFVGVFALHVVTEAPFDDPGRVRIWPPLRRAIGTTDHATLTPTLAMRLVGEGAAPLGRGLTHVDAPTVTMVEIEHRDLAALLG